MGRKWSIYKYDIGNKTHNDHHNTNHIERPSKTNMVESHRHRLGDIFWLESSHHINWFSGFCPSSKNLLEIPPKKKVWMLRQLFKAIRFHGASCFHGLARKNVGWTNPLLLQQHPAKTYAWRVMENGPMGHGLKLFTPENERMSPENQWLESMYSQLK